MDRDGMDNIKVGAFHSETLFVFFWITVDAYTFQYAEFMLHVHIYTFRNYSW